MSDVAKKIEERRHILEDLAESDLPVADLAEGLLYIADEER